MIAYAVYTESRACGQSSKKKMASMGPRFQAREYILLVPTLTGRKANCFSPSETFGRAGSAR